MNTPKLELYFFPSCPFCQFVLFKIQELDVDVTLKNINEDMESRNKLYADTGRYTVPCLYIDGKPMHESAEINEWLEKNKDQLKKK